ncbi:hypothetical protein FBUS_02068 [Fasciolopsis buskii]|uniref:Uncharacterized protein n=1 Tax=Fasciolopsis buskii TaxID=27845 RepID=A0A8E0VHM5_9TREM|nr:hypothetical protein FBUS_02068 [Fasciolopsis buski]
MASPSTLSASAELGLADRLVREIPPPSPSSQSSRSSSFDSFSTRVGSVDNRIGSSLSPSSFGDVSERETHVGATVQPPLFRRNLSDSGPTIRPHTRIFDPRRNTLAAPIHPFTTSASLPAGSESPKPVSSYTRSTTTPIFNSNQKPSTVNRDHHPSAWTTISRREELKQPLDIKVDDTGKWKSNGYTSLSTQKADIGTQTELSPDWILSPDADRGSCESLPSDLLSGGPVLQTWPLSLQSVVRPTDVDSEVERANLNGWNASSADVNSFVDEDSQTERTETSGSPTPVPSPTSMVQTNRSAFSRPLMRRHSMKGAVSERPITLTLGEQPNLQSHRLSLSRPVRSTLGSPIYGTGTTDAPRCRSVHFSSDVLVAHTGSGPEPLLLSSAPLKEPAPCEVNDDRSRSKPISKPFIIGPRRFSLSGRQQPTETNFQELQISINQNQPQPRLPRPTPFRRNLVPRGASEPNL